MNSAWLESCTTVGATDGAQPGGSSMVFIIIIFVVMFAMMIIPQRRRQKKVQEMLSAIKSGDRIKTIGGFYGRVVSVNDALVVISVDPDGTKMTISKTAVATVENADVESDVEPGSK
ncbi:MAG: preprotein translocase subunit YajC [Eubacteriales bacterium]